MAGELLLSDLQIQREPLGSLMENLLGYVFLKRFVSIKCSLQWYIIWNVCIAEWKNSYGS